MNEWREKLPALAPERKELIVLGRWVGFSALKHVWSIPPSIALQPILYYYYMLIYKFRLPKLPMAAKRV